MSFLFQVGPLFLTRVLASQTLRTGCLWRPLSNLSLQAVASLRHQRFQLGDRLLRTAGLGKRQQRLLADPQAGAGGLQGFLAKSSASCQPISSMREPT